MKKMVVAKRRAATAKTLPPIDPAPIDVEMDQSAQQFLDSEPQLKALGEQIELGPEQFITRAADLISKVTRKQHHKALALAYCIWLRASHNVSYANYVARLRSLQPNKRSIDLHLIVQAIVTYGGQAPEERLSKRGLYQRDVAALRYLHSQHVGPDQLEDQATKVGEGLDAWARRWPKVKKSGASNRSERDQAKTSIEVILRMTVSEGVVTTERFAIADNDAGRRVLDVLRNLLRDAESPLAKSTF